MSAFRIQLRLAKAGHKTKIKEKQQTNKKGTQKTKIVITKKLIEIIIKQCNSGRRVSKIN